MNKYEVKTDETGASICMNGECPFLESFIDIYIDDMEINSPFDNIVEAQLFATVIVNLLQELDKNKERLHDIE